MAVVRGSRVSGKRSTGFFDYANSSVEENRVWTELPHWKPDNSRSPKSQNLQSGLEMFTDKRSIHKATCFPSELVSSEDRKMQSIVALCCWLSWE